MPSCLPLFSVVSPVALLAHFPGVPFGLSEWSPNEQRPPARHAGPTGRSLHRTACEGLGRNGPTRQAAGLATAMIAPTLRVVVRNSCLLFATALALPCWWRVLPAVVVDLMGSASTR